MTIRFFNHYHNGDVHLSRQLVKYVMSVAGENKYVYHHTNSSRLLLDVKGLEHDTRMLDITNVERSRYAGDLWLNTWYCASPVWMQFSCTYPALHGLFGDHLKTHFGHDLPNEPLVPVIDFSYFETQSVRDFMGSVVDKYRRKVLVCNCAPQSGQSHANAWTLTEVSYQLALKHTDVLFLLTNGQQTLPPLPNVVYTSDVIGLPSGVSDLNENAFVSTFCDVIVGLSSGPYSFSYIAENLSDEKKTFLCFTHEARFAGWGLPASLLKACAVASTSTSRDSLFCEIEETFGEGR